MRRMIEEISAPICVMKPARSESPARISIIPTIQTKRTPGLRFIDSKKTAFWALCLVTFDQPKSMNMKPMTSRSISGASNW